MSSLVDVQFLQAMAAGLLVTAVGVVLGKRKRDAGAANTVNAVGAVAAPVVTPVATPPQTPVQVAPVPWLPVPAAPAAAVAMPVPFVVCQALIADLLLPHGIRIWQGGFPTARGHTRMTGFDTSGNRGLQSATRGNVWVQHIHAAFLCLYGNARRASAAYVGVTVTRAMVMERLARLFKDAHVAGNMFTSYRHAGNTVNRFLAGIPYAQMTVNRNDSTSPKSSDSVHTVQGFASVSYWSVEFFALLKACLMRRGLNHVESNYVATVGLVELVGMTMGLRRDGVHPIMPADLGVPVIVVRPELK